MYFICFCWYFIGSHFNYFNGSQSVDKTAEITASQREIQMSFFSMTDEPSTASFNKLESQFLRALLILEEASLESWQQHFWDCCSQQPLNEKVECSLKITTYLFRALPGGENLALQGKPVRWEPGVTERPFWPWTSLRLTHVLPGKWEEISPGKDSWNLSPISCSAIHREGFPCWPSDWDLTFQSRGCGFSPWSESWDPTSHCQKKHKVKQKQHHKKVSKDLKHG